MSKESEEQGIGCLLVAWGIFIVGPMWYVLIFQLLAASDVQPWVWILYWAYVPVGVVGQILNGLLKLLMQEK